jgi:hypothetical protein
LTIYFASTTTGTAYGVILEVCDDNVFHNVHFTAAGTSATIKPYYFDYSVSNLFPSGNVIDITDPAMLGCGSLASGGCGTSDTGTVGHNFTNNGTPGAGSSANYLNNLQLTNGARYPLNLPNLLVDKAQAAWTPTFHGSNGWVTEAGYDVTIYFNLTAPIAAPMTGDLLLTSLPVAVGSGNNEIAACVVVANGVVFSGGRSGVYLAPQAGTQQMAVGEFGGSGSAGSLPIADISGSGIALFGQCKYHR